MARITLTRQQLYDRAWMTPIDNLAKELGLSGRGLGKLCVRHNIPVPPRGYWAKRAFGKRVSKPALPSPESCAVKISFNPSPASAEDEAAQPELHPLLVFEGLPQNRISVANDLALTHPLALRAERLLAKAKQDPNGLVRTPSGALSIYTSRLLHERALRILQALLTTFGSRGFSGTSDADGLQITVLDEPLKIGIVENTKPVAHRVSFTEQKLIDRGLGHQVPKFDQIPSGTLTLVITNVRHVRQRWTEGARPLEALLNKFMVGLVRAALGLKKQRAEAERRERERQEQERRRQEEARRQAEAARRWQEEQGRMERLERLAAIWRRNQELRQLVTTVQASVGEVDADTELGKWLAWATEHVETSDPLRHLRNRQSRTLTVYYHGWDHDRVSEQGFRESEPSGHRDEKTKSGIELTCSPPTSSSWYGPGALKLELAEDLLLPFEWAQSSDWYYRLFRVPASVLNRLLAYGASEGDPGSEDSDNDDEC